jgi:hypothetical protein
MKPLPGSLGNLNVFDDEDVEGIFQGSETRDEGSVGNHL